MWPGFSPFYMYMAIRTTDPVPRQRPGCGRGFEEDIAILFSLSAGYGATGAVVCGHGPAVRTSGVCFTVLWAFSVISRVSVPVLAGHGQAALSVFPARVLLFACRRRGSQAGRRGIR